MARRRPGVFYGWWIVLAAFVQMGFGSMTSSFGMSLFYKRLIDQFGWTRASLAGAISLAELETGFLGGIEGFLVDRYGPRPLILGGTILMSLGFVWLSRINSLLDFYLVFVLMVTVGRSLSTAIVLDTAIANWFIRRRGTAFGIQRMSVAVGAAGVILVAWFLELYGWRAGFVAAGVLSLIVGIPVAFVMRSKPGNYGMLPDGDSEETRNNLETAVSESTGPSSSAVAMGMEEDIGMTVKEALASRAFWALSGGYAVRLMVTGAATLHAVPLLEDMGYSRVTAAAVLGSMGMVSVIGRLGGGILNDIVGTRLIVIFSAFTLAISCVILAYAQNLWHVWLFVVIYAPSYGASAATMPAIRGDYFGRKAFGTILGLSGMAQMVGAFIGPVFAGYIYDVTGSYRIAFLAFAALLLVAVAMFMTLGKPRYGGHSRRRQ